jgi:serine/threonine protein kinase
MTLASGTKLGPYEIHSQLGAGGLGEVYRARDTRLGRTVAIKVLSAESTRKPENLVRFEQEAKAASALNHPNILTVYDVGESDGTRYIATEFVEGHSGWWA